MTNRIGRGDSEYGGGGARRVVRSGYCVCTLAYTYEQYNAFNLPSPSSRSRLRLSFACCDWDVRAQSQESLVEAAGRGLMRVLVLVPSSCMSCARAEGGTVSVGVCTKSRDCTWYDGAQEKKTGRTWGTRVLRESSLVYSHSESERGRPLSAQSQESLDDFAGAGLRC